MIFRSFLQWGALALMASLIPATTQAAIITLDLRIAGGGKTAQVTTSGQVVNLELYAQIQNTDNNRANDGFQLAHGGLTSTELASGLLGNLAPLTLNNTFAVVPFASGSQNSLDGNADFEIGGLDSESTTGWIQLNSGTSAFFGTGTGSGVTEFLLGTTTWTNTVLGTSETSLNFFPRIRTGGTAAQKLLFKGRSDGVDFSLNAGLSPDFAVGAPVNITATAIPEPGTYALGTIILAGLAGWKVRRNKA